MRSVIIWFEFAGRSLQCDNPKCHISTISTIEIRNLGSSLKNPSGSAADIGGRWVCLLFLNHDTVVYHNDSGGFVFLFLHARRPLPAVPRIWPSLWVILLLLFNWRNNTVNLLATLLLIAVVKSNSVQILVDLKFPK